jgi:site-specific DNA recombinase
MDDTIRTALYARVSSERQADELTIQSQVAGLRQRIAQDSLKVDEELCFLDEGYSGSTLIRPALEKLRDVAYCGGIDRLYVHSPDRLARKYAYQVLLLEEFRKCDVEVVFPAGTVARRRVAVADARDDRGIRAGQDPGAYASRQALCGASGKSERSGARVLRLSLCDPP